MAALSFIIQLVLSTFVSPETSSVQPLVTMCDFHHLLAPLLAVS